MASYNSSAPVPHATPITIRPKE